MRLLTKRITSVGEFGLRGEEAAYLQVGFVLTLQNAQQRELVVAVLGVALLGLLGAAPSTGGREARQYRRAKAKRKTRAGMMIVTSRTRRRR